MHHATRIFAPRIADNWPGSEAIARTKIRADFVVVRTAPFGSTCAHDCRDAIFVVFGNEQISEVETFR